MTRAQRLLTLAYRAHQRKETEIAGRIVALAFAEPDVAAVFEKINAEQSTTSQDPVVDKAEAILRAAEATTQGNVFSDSGQNQLLAIAQKVHKSGMPKVAQSILRAAN